MHQMLLQVLQAETGFFAGGWAILGLLSGIGLTTLWHRNRPQPTQRPASIESQEEPSPGPAPFSATVAETNSPNLLLSECELKSQVLDYVMSHIIPEIIHHDHLKQQTEHVRDQFRLIGLLQRLNVQDEQRLPDDFENRLHQLHPELTDEELKLCGYAYLGFNSRQIAQLKNISPAGVSKARTRLRKKLQLPAAVTLDNFIRESRGESLLSTDQQTANEQL